MAEKQAVDFALKSLQKLFSPMPMTSQTTQPWSKVDEAILETVVAQCPPRFYESNWFFAPVIVVFTLLLHASVVPKIGFSPPIWLSILVVIGYASAAVLDSITTQRCMELKPAFEALGVEFPMWESNPLLPLVSLVIRHLNNRMKKLYK